MSKKPGSGNGNAVGKVMDLLKEHSVEYVDFRFTDPRGKWQHTAQHVSTIEDETFRDGVMFDGSSIAGCPVARMRPLPSFALRYSTAISGIGPSRMAAVACHSSGAPSNSGESHRPIPKSAEPVMFIVQSVASPDCLSKWAAATAAYRHSE